MNRSSVFIGSPINPGTGSFTSQSDIIGFPQSIDSLDNVIKIISGSDHCYAITSNKQVFAWGSNTSNRLGFFLSPSEIIIKTPTPLISLSDKSINNIATGNEHTFAWSDETGEVYAWGSGNYGKLGFGHNQNITEPAILECFQEARKVGMKITSIACGDNHTLAILNTLEDDEKKEEREENKKLFVWGSSKNWQLGLDNDFGPILIPHQIDPDPWNGTIVQAYACNNYSAALNSKGEMFTWGSGEFGRLGYETETKQQKVPRIIKAFYGKKIIKVALGGYHVGAITSDGVLYTWGRGINGQLGHSSIHNEDIPKEVKFAPGIQLTHVSCGENHTLAVSSEGEVYAWGANQYGQLGIGNVIRVNQPFNVSCFTEYNIAIIDISCGKKHTLALSDQGVIFSWGSNEFGQLGLEVLGATQQQRKEKYKGSQQINSPSELSGLFQRSKTNGDVYMSNKTNAVEGNPHFQNIEKTATFIETKTPGETGTLTDFMPVSQIQDPILRKVVIENKLLRGRIKELEFKNDVDNYQKNEEQIYAEANTCLQVLDSFILTPSSNSNIESLELEIVNKNAKVDKAVQDFKKKIDEIKDLNFNAGYFCIQIMEKYSKLLKKSNYFNEKK